MNLKINLALAAMIVTSSVVFAAGKATVKVTGTPTKTGATLAFTTIPADNLKINAEGPWKLEIKKVTGVKPAAMEYKAADWKESVSGFEVPVTVDKGAKTADVTYKMTTFICTKDKAMCYREVVEDTAKVALK